MADPNSVFDRLRSMGVQMGTKHLSPGKPREVAYGIERVLTGQDIATMYGQAFVVKDGFPKHHQHGRLSICPQCSLDVLAAWSGTPRITQSDGQNVVFLDTETSGLAGGTGTYAFLIGIGYQTADGFELIQFFMRDPDQEAAVLAALDQWLARFDVVVTFNGKTFDLPLLNTRYLMNGLSSPFGAYEHLDVLQIARKLWRDRLPSRALGELEKEIVQFYRTTEEVPGWLIPQLYFDYLRSGDARPLAGVFYHNGQDILSLAALYGHVAEMLNNPLGQAVGYGLDLAAIARLYEELGWIDQAASLYESCLERGDLPEEFFLKTMQRYALLHRRRGDWEHAVTLWQKAAEHGELSACIELSKYYEHRVRNYHAALEWARKALELLDLSPYYAVNRRTVERDIERRIGRLYPRALRS